MSWWTEAPRTSFTDQAVQLFEARYTRVAVTAVKREARAPESRRCDVCQRKFALNLRGPDRRYCSHACNQRAWKRRQVSP
jgi:hypothetical protein